MNIRQAIERYPEAVSVEVYDFTGKRRSILSNQLILHADNISKALEEYSLEDEIISADLMYGGEYENTVLADGSLSWEEIEDSFPILVIMRK